MLRIASLLILMCLTVNTSARANVTAPVLGIQTSSTELFSPGSPLIVKNEKLRLACYPSGCTVTARYLIQADTDVKANLEFISDMKQSGGRGNQVTITHEGTSSSSTMTPKHTFTAVLKKGDNSIEIEYSHTIARNLVSPAYFNSYSVDYITYDLWPLKGWKLADDFTLDVEFYYRQDVIGIIDRMFGSDYRQVSINGWDRNSGINNIAEPRSTSLAVLYKGWDSSGSHTMQWDRRFGREFPDRLLIYFAPEQEVTHFSNTGVWERPR